MSSIKDKNKTKSKNKNTNTNEQAIVRANPPIPPPPPPPPTAPIIPVEPIVNNPITNTIEQKTNTNKAINPPPTPIITAEALINQFPALSDPLVLARLTALANRVEPVLWPAPTPPPAVTSHPIARPTPLRPPPSESQY